MAGTNKDLLCLFFCLLMLLAIMSSAQEAGDIVDSKKKCVRVWQGYCVKKRTCERQCNDPKLNHGYTNGHCELWTCVCCESSPAPSPSTMTYDI
ncbi:hypothetical protein HU200_054589 [Digitaria exilis]|uniref:Defensin n=1 Tax=Digitaria exilis TaxID=1010633 RepID=A0A835E7C1_9POAL|nr:hypothetical protein HU200_054589 [Digitaria exilis]